MSTILRYLQEHEIKKLAKEGNNDGCRILAKQLVQLRKQKQRSYAAGSKVQGISFQNKAMGANVKLAEAMGTAGKTMSDMNKIMKPEQVAATVNAFSRENMKMEMTDEMSMYRLLNMFFHCSIIIACIIQIRINID